MPKQQQPRFIQTTDQRTSEIESEAQRSIWSDKKPATKQQKRGKSIWPKKGRFSAELLSEIGKALWMKKKNTKGGRK